MSCGGGRADTASRPHPSLCCHHCSPHTLRHIRSLTRTHPHPTHTTDPAGLTPSLSEEGKTRSLAPGGPALAVVKGVEWRGGVLTGR